MSIEEAEIYVHIVLNGLTRMGVISETRHLTMTQMQLDKLAALVKEKSEE